jgi:transcriptional/translational regulatory protein YebC/TACO1
VLVDAVTDNRTRTATDLRHLFDEHGGRLGEAGSVSWLFETRAVVTVATAAVPEDRLLEVALELGAADVKTDADSFRVLAEPARLVALREGLEKARIPVQNAEVSRIPKSEVSVTGSEAKRLLGLLGALDENDDVQRTFANFDVSEEEMKALVGA